MFVPREAMNKSAESAGLVEGSSPHQTSNIGVSCRCRCSLTGSCAAELVTFLIWIEGSCFAINACVPMAVAYFRHGFITKGDGIKYVVRNGTDTF